MSHRKFWYGLSALLLAVSAVRAAPPLAVTATPKEPVTADEVRVPGVASPLTGTFNAIYCTGFEAPDWSLGTSICGPAFAGCIGNVSVGNVCEPKAGVLVNGNCCDKDPNVETGWSYNGLCRHCREPHIDNVHPSNMKGPSLQHLRSQYDPTGGSPVGCTGSGGGCRIRFGSPWDRNQPDINRSVYKYDISFSHDFIGTATVVRNFFGNILNGGGIYLNAYVLFTPGGQVYGFTNSPYASRVRNPLGYWTYDAPDYAQVTVDFDPCNNKLTYTYAGKPNPLVPTGISVVTESHGFSPPYGDFAVADKLWTFNDNFVWSQNHNNDGQLIDLDNFCITHIPCPDACCYNDGRCVEGLSQTECETPKGKYYPNVSCEQLGTPGYPPACGVAKGSCCDAGPRAGGACTDGVAEADCTGAQLTWTKGAQCEEYSTLCHVGYGYCNTDPNDIGDKQDGLCGLETGLCTEGNAIDAPCALDVDCDREKPGICQGECVEGDPLLLGTQCKGNPSCDGAGPPGMGICGGPLGLCQGTPPGAPCPGGDIECPPTITLGVCTLDAGHCLEGLVGNVCAADADCNSPGFCITFPSRACNVDADCTVEGFCYNGLCGNSVCSNSATTMCSSDAGCTAPGTCVTYVCNGDSGCPGVAGPCVVPGVSPGGFLCDDDADCVIPAAPPCDEHLGACCDGETGICLDDQFEIDCKGGQKVWSKLGVCTGVDAVPCVRHKGACCDHSPLAGGKEPEGTCRDTYPEDCTAAQETWSKGVLCADAICIETPGACCEFLKGTCEDGVYAGDCQGTQEAWHKAETCEAVELRGECEAVLGACCDTDTFGDCQQTTQNGCVTNCKTCVWYKLLTCGQITCTHAAIPTVSTWGLAILTLLLLVGAKVYFGRRQSAAA
jgi:hypothetical protein